MKNVRSLANFLSLFMLIASANSSVLAQTRTGQDEPVFKISTPLEFKGRVVSGSLRKSEIEALLDLPIRNGNSDLKEGYGVEMTRPSGGKFMAYTCREWEKAQYEKAYSATTYDMAMEGSLIHTCGLLFQLQNARLPLKSFVANPRVTLADINLLPAEILGVNGDEEDEENNERRLRGLTISQAVPAKDIQEANRTFLRLSFGGFQQLFQEAARADFDGNGFEEIFVFTGGRAEGGTLGYADNLILTRTNPSDPLKLVQAKNRDRSGSNAAQ
ncbi:MAG: hypothetical protein WB627_07040 [Candidatus Acidiferrum sp.]